MESSERETRAIFLNFKEVRSLEKNVKSLDLEKAYNISLINLDQQVIKVKFKRLKEKASRIKSYLPQDELEKMKKLEEEGKLKIKVPESDLHIKISAAEKRLKLMPRAKSAAPRLQREPEEENIQRDTKTPRSARRLRITTPTTPKTPTSTGLLSPKVKKDMKLDRPVSARMGDTEVNKRDYLCPNTIRQERRKSIFHESNSDDVNKVHVVAKHAPTINIIEEFDDDKSDISSTNGQTLNRSKSSKNGSKETNAKKTNIIPNVIVSASEQAGDGVQETSPQFITNGIQGNGDNRTSNATTLNINADGTETKQHHGDTNSDAHTAINVPILQIEDYDTNIEKVDKDTLSEHQAVSTEEKLENSSSGLKMHHTSVSDNSSVMGNVNDKTSHSPVYSAESTSRNTNDTKTASVKSKLRPMSVPATQITDFNKVGQKARPKTAIELAVETRKKSMIDIRRASTMLKEGKTRSPFSCHEPDNGEKRIKPFRSIREGANSTSNDNEIFDNTLGDDLHKEMKKGMILGEVATNLYLEDKIDHFLEKVDTYVKENPNYIYDPNAEKKKVPRANKDKKTRPKRNRLRRRQLEIQLHEANVDEMKKSRWLRAEDDQLDSTGINTLVIDQMKMLNRLKHPYDDDDY